MTRTLQFPPVRPELIGEAETATKPGDDPRLYGSAVLEGPAEVEVRSYQTFRLTYTVGALGLDDTGGIRVAFRLISDAGPLQTHDPAGANYVTARSSGEGALELKYDKIGGQRPWNETLTVFQRGGYLKPGETIEIVFGDTAGGSPGLLMPTFVDSGREFRVMADVQATGNYVSLPDTQLCVAVVPGMADRHFAVLPTLRRPGEPFTLGLKAEDRWGNPTNLGARSFTVAASLPVNGLPDRIDFDPVGGAMTLEDLTIDREGVLWIALTDDIGESVEAGPLHVRAGDVAHFWGDLHGQTGETVGTNTAEHYFDFARNKSFLDVSSHQGNDFQIKSAFWAQLNDLTARFDAPGRFTVLPGYEWSGNTAVGGDHNVFYREEGAAIYRCSHALIADRSDAGNDAHTLTDLYAKLHAEPVDAVLYAHVGGRYADIHYDHDPRLEAAVEVHSAWGTFEWILTDGFEKRRRVGVVCNSDGHKGRPGSSYPGASIFGAYGGLTCFIMAENTRDAVFEAIRRRHTYGTTGCRAMVSLDVTLPGGGTLFLRNPDGEPDTETRVVTACMMGDIVRTAGDHAEVEITVDAPVGIASIELRDGLSTREIWRPYGADDLGDRVRVMWSGAEYRGRGRNTTWQGRAQFRGCAVDRFEAVNKLNPELLLKQVGRADVVWKAVTTGNMMGFDAWTTVPASDATLEIRTNQGDLDLGLDAIGIEPVVLDAGGLAKQLRVQRLPNGRLPRSAHLKRTIPIAETGDTPVWICVTFEDGNQAWTSPAYLFRD